MVRPASSEVRLNAVYVAVLLDTVGVSRPPRAVVLKSWDKGGASVAYGAHMERFFIGSRGSSPVPEIFTFLHHLSSREAG
jgi:hypothetical protein